MIHPRQTVSQRGVRITMNKAPPPPRRYLERLDLAVSLLDLGLEVGSNVALGRQQEPVNQHHCVRAARSQGKQDMRAHTSCQLIGRS